MRQFTGFSIFLLQLFIVPVLSQETKTDSLKNILYSLKEDSTKVDLLNTLSEILLNSKPEEAIEYGVKARIISEQINFDMGLGAAYKNIGIGYFMLGKYIECVDNLANALKIYQSIKDSVHTAEILSQYGSIYYTLGDESQAISYFRQGLNVIEGLGDSDKTGSFLLNIGDIYSNEKAQTDSALFYFRSGLQLGESAGNMDLIGLSIIHLGELYFKTGDYDSSFYYFDKSLSVISNNVDYSISLNYLGNIYTEKGDYLKAIQYHQDALDMADAEDSPIQQIHALLGMATTYHKKGDQHLAIDYFNQAKSSALEVSSDPDLSIAYRGLAISYAELSEFQEAYNYLTLKDQVDEEYSRIESDRIKYLLILYSSHEKDKDAEIDILEQQSIIEQLKNKRRTILNITSGSIGFLLLLLAAGLFHRFYYIRKTNVKINSQKNEIEIQRDEIKIQRDQLVSQRKDIMDSLRYAHRIQDALLPSQEYIRSLLSEYFIIYRPRDIVSGDFYWIKEFNNHLVLIGADCTGHGVPGGFMSMLGVTLLNDLIGPDNLEHPDKILEQLRTKIKEMLVQKGRLDEQKDGMDMAIAVLDRTNGQLRFAGANYPLYLIRKNNGTIDDSTLIPFLSLKNNNYSLYEIKGDKQPIGVYWEEAGFHNHTVNFREQDTFYIFSDGIVDQYGGDHRKKFKVANFKRLLLSIQSEPMETQKNRIEEAFASWKGNLEQIDDVSVIGIRV